MTTFVDTSAFYALLCRLDPNHEAARGVLEQLLSDGATPITSNYVVVESCALIQHRLGMEALRVFVEDLLGPVRVIWIGPDIHSAAVSVLVIAGRRKLSLVDCVSFELMRRQRVVDAFCFDEDFASSGFRVRPERIPRESKLRD